MAAGITDHVWELEELLAGGENMPSSPKELELALMNFRDDILKAFIGIEVEIVALQNAVMEDRPVSRKRLNELRDRAGETAHQFRDRYAELIRPAHQVR